VASFRRINSALPLYAMTALAALLFLGALAVMAAIAGWNRVVRAVPCRHVVLVRGGVRGRACLWGALTRF
jgi:predicted naringenin-chalcone synthase